MVRLYKRKSTRLNWNEGQMQLAIQTVLNDGQSCKATASKFGVPRSTLAKKCKSQSRVGQTISQAQMKAVGFTRVFDDEQEKGLKTIFTKMETSLMAVTAFDVRKTAFDFAEKINISHNFNPTKGLAGKDWLRNFLKRHNFALRKAEHTETTETIPAKVKKGRARGKSAIITDNLYKENLMAEKLKNMKKEKSDKKTVASKPVIKSNIPLELPLNVTTPKTIQPRNRKQPASNTARKKREPLATLNHQAPQVPDLLPTDNQIYQIVDNSVVPIKGYVHTPNGRFNSSVLF